MTDKCTRNSNSPRLLIPHGISRTISLWSAAHRRTTLHAYGPPLLHDSNNSCKMWRSI